MCGTVHTATKRMHYTYYTADERCIKGAYGRFRQCVFEAYIIDEHYGYMYLWPYIYAYARIETVLDDHRYMLQ